MNRASTLSLVAAAALGAASAVVLFSDPANADRGMGTASTSAAVIDHGTWRRLPDAGFAFTVHGSTTNLVDGGAVLLENDTITCEPGAWNSAPATCVAAWKAANAL